MKNEKFIHALILKTNPKARKLNKMTRSEAHKNKKVIIGDNPVLYPDGAVTMDQDCDRGKSFGGRRDG